MNKFSTNKNLVAVPIDSSDTGRRIERILAVFHMLFDDFCHKGDHDRHYVAALLEEFGEYIDVEDELRQFQAWMLDQGSEDKQQYRSRFRSWLKKARRPQYTRN